MAARSFLFSYGRNISREVNKRSGEVFSNQVYSNTDLINAYLHIHASVKSVLNNI